MVRLTSLMLLLSMASLAFAQSSVQTRTDIFYGDDPNHVDREMQTLDIYFKADATKQPVVIYLHGGGWAFGDKAEVNHKPDFFVPAGFAFVSMNYRLRWDYKLFDQLQDVIKVIDWVHKNAAAYGLNSDRIVLMGHGAGGHLASLVGTDPRHLKGGGYELSDLKAVVSIDSISYDIPRVHRELGSYIERRQHRLVFGEDESIQRQASPITHVKQRKGMPAFALLYVLNEEGTRLQAEGFAKAITQASGSVIMIPGNTKTKRSINIDLGSEGDVPSGALMAFLRAST